MWQSSHSYVPPHMVHKGMETAVRLADMTLKNTVPAYMAFFNLIGGGSQDPARFADAFRNASLQMMMQPSYLAQRQLDLWMDYSRLWQNTLSRLYSDDQASLFDAPRGDRRFRDAQWQESPFFNAVKQNYLLTSRWVIDTVAKAEGLDEKTRTKVLYLTHQFLDSVAPSNFPLSNPAVLREIRDSKGENLFDGLNNLLDDLQRSESGTLRVNMTDRDAFEVGDNLACTPGKVVFQNEILQLIQYSPATEQVSKTPLLMVPPPMNKFYIMDLSPENSMVKWLVEQGQTVFMISWVNPDRSHANKTFEDYVLDGTVAAVDAIIDITGEAAVNAVGYCLGGILLTTTVAYLAGKNDKRIKSGTFFTTLMDFENAGEISVFIDEETVDELEASFRERGYMDGNALGLTFRFLRANDLYWSFFVNNYLMGKNPAALDLLYWNSDPTNIPATMHAWMIRSMYLQNKLRKPGGFQIGGIPIDVSQVETPTYAVAAREDHITPWKNCYPLTTEFAGPRKFVLAGSGHIAGIINPPADQKRGYWLNRYNPTDPDRWLEKATEYQGSWWPDWVKWLSGHGGGKVPARVPGADGQNVIESAPGSYVKVRID